MSGPITRKKRERKKYMAAHSLLKKLQLKGDQRAVIINPPPGYLDELGPLPEGNELLAASPTYPSSALIWVQSSRKTRQAFPPKNFVWISSGKFIARTCWTHCSQDS